MLGKKYWNTVLLALGFILLIVSSVYFFIGFRIDEIRTVRDIGVVFKKDNDLRRKSDSSLTWVDIGREDRIYPGDKVFTGSQSIAQLNLLDLAEVGMASSTLLKIDMMDRDSLSMESGHGLFNIKLSKNMKSATVKAGGKTVELSGQGSEVQVNSDEKRTMITALAGNVTYQSVGLNGKIEKKTLAPNQILGIDKKGIMTVVSIPARLITPSVSEEVLANEGAAIAFKWKTLNPSVALSLELSKTPSFENVFFKNTVTGLTESQVKIDSKNYGMIFWRVVDPSKDDYFHSQQFEYQPLTAPVVYRPVNREIVPIPLPKKLEFSWEKRFDFSYDGEIEQLDGGSVGIQKFNTAAVTHLPKGLTAGHHRFRVRATKKKLVSDWSEWVPFSVGDVDRQGIELVSPVDKSVAQLAFPEKEVQFRWTGGGVQSQILVAEDAEFKKLVVEAITNSNVYRWTPEKSGTYYWYVKSGPKDKIGAYRSFSVKEPKLTLHSPKDDLEYIYEEEGYQDVKFEWEPASFNGKYLFEYSNSPDFAKLIESVDLERTEHVVSFRRIPQEIFWRVKTASQVSPSRSIMFKPLQKLPAIAVKNLQVKIQEDKTVLGGVSDRNRKSEPTGFIEMLIPQSEQAASYQIDVLRGQDPGSVLFSKALKSPLFRWTNPAPGNYFYRLSYTDRSGKKSPGSEIARLIILPMDKPVQKAKPTPAPAKAEEKLPTY